MPLQLMRAAALSLVLCAIVFGCGGFTPDTLDGSPRYNLNRPFYLYAAPTMPKATMVVEGMRRAIGRAGGSTTIDERASQVINMLDTDGGRCPEKGVEAWAETGKIYFCHSMILLSSFTQRDMEQIAMHELGHLLANKGAHLGGDPPPGTCTSHAIMALNRACRTSDDYTPDDRHYICDTRNVVGGICE